MEIRIDFKSLLIFTASLAQAQIALEPWVGVGEQPRPGDYRGVYGSSYWQGGATFAYDWTWLRPYAELAVNPPPSEYAWGLEGLLGVGLGHEIGWFKPMLTWSTGFQSVKSPEYRPYDLPDGFFTDSPAPYVMRRQTHRVSRLGFRGELFGRIWMDWEGDLGDRNPAIPMWRMRLGYHRSFDYQRNPKR
jgi:hypothetical protein